MLVAHGSMLGRDATDAGRKREEERVQVRFFRPNTALFTLPP